MTVNSTNLAVVKVFSHQTCALGRTVRPWQKQPNSKSDIKKKTLKKTRVQFCHKNGMKCEQRPIGYVKFT